MHHWVQCLIKSSRVQQLRIRLLLRCRLSRDPTNDEIQACAADQHLRDQADTLPRKLILKALQEGFLVSINSLYVHLSFFANSYCMRDTDI